MNSDHKQKHNKSNSWWLSDAKGIPVARVCSECIHDVKSQYNPGIFDLDEYSSVVEETIDPE